MAIEALGPLLRHMNRMVALDLIQRQGLLPIFEEGRQVMAAVAVTPGNPGILNCHIRMARVTVHITLDHRLVIDANGLFRQLGRLQLAFLIRRKHLMNRDFLLRQCVAQQTTGGSGIE